MGFGPPSRRPFLFFAENNMVRDWYNLPFDAIKHVAVAIDSNVVLNMILKESDKNTELSTEEFVRRELSPRIRVMIRKMLSPFVRSVGCSPPLEHETESRGCFGSSLPSLTVFAVCDNGAPAMKAYAHERRRGASRHEFLSKLKEVMPLFCEVVCESASNLTGCNSINLSYAEGEGEYTCVKILANCSFEKSLLLVASSDSDLILYSLFACKAEPSLNLGMIVLNNAAWNSSKFEGRETLKLVFFREFVRMITSRDVSIECYTSAAALLLGNDFLPSFVKSTVSFTKLHNFICDSLKQHKSFSFKQFVRTIQAANVLNMLKSNSRVQITISDKSEALRELHRVLSVYKKYISSASVPLNRISLSGNKKQIEDACKGLLSRTHEATRNFYAEPPFIHYFVFNSGMTAASWRAVVAKLLRKLENEVADTAAPFDDKHENKD